MLIYHFSITSLTVNILSVKAVHKQTSRVDTVLPFSVSITGHSPIYLGPVSVTVALNDTSLTTNDIVSTTGETTVNVGLQGKGPVEFTVTARNDISHAVDKTIVNVVGKFSLLLSHTVLCITTVTTGPGDYAELSIKFSKLPSQYNDSVWQEHLKTSVKSSVIGILKLDNDDLLEMLRVRIVFQNDTQATNQDSRDIVKRQTVQVVPFAYVDFNILPMDSSSQSIYQAFAVSDVSTIYYALFMLCST